VDVGLAKATAGPLKQWLALFPGWEDQLPVLNEALRNLLRGKMDHLPYYTPVPGYELAMRAVLEPQGEGRPPRIGTWQLELVGFDPPRRLYLQGKREGEEELGLLWQPE